MKSDAGILRDSIALPESAAGAAHSKTWRNIVGAFCLVVAPGISLSILHAQPAADNVPRLDGHGSFVEFPSERLTHLTGGEII